MHFQFKALTSFAQDQLAHLVGPWSLLNNIASDELRCEIDPRRYRQTRSWLNKNNRELIIAQSEQTPSEESLPPLKAQLVLTSAGLMYREVTNVESPSVTFLRSAKAEDLKEFQINLGDVSSKINRFGVLSPEYRKMQAVQAVK